MFQQSIIKKLSNFIAIAAVIVIIGGISRTYADTPDNNTELKRIRSQIHTLESSLKTAKNQRGELRQRLQTTEKRIGKISKTLRQIAQDKKRLEKELKQLKKKKLRLLDEQKIHFQALREHIMTSYAIGRQGMTKLLLNQEEPTKIGRQLTYYRYLNGARLREIDTVKAGLEEAAVLEAVIINKNNQVEKLKKDTLIQKKILQKDKKERITVMAKLNSQIQQTGKRLERLAEDAQRLENLVKGLGSNTAKALEMPLDTPFAARKGTMPWPTKGRLSAQFGKRRESGKLKWQGIMIDTKEGADISTIAPGRVVFADWLRGYGLLIIIDHGGGYLSLYGHNQSLLTENGDWVSGSETIAIAGNSGGRNSTGLYFELRYNGKPSNPVAWLHGSKP